MQLYSTTQNIIEEFIHVSNSIIKKNIFSLIPHRLIANLDFS